MFDLNDVRSIRLADAHDMLGQVADLPQQLIDGWAAAEAIDLPLSFREVDRVVLAGMGGLAGGGAGSRERDPRLGVQLGAGLLRRVSQRAPARQSDAGSARLFRRAYFPTNRQRGRLSRPVVLERFPVVIPARREAWQESSGWMPDTPCPRCARGRAWRSVRA